MSDLRGRIDAVLAEALPGLSAELREQTARRVALAVCNPPDSHSERELLESIWRKIDGLAEMLRGPSRPPSPRGGPMTEAHPEDVQYVVRAWSR